MKTFVKATWLLTGFILLWDCICQAQVTNTNRLLSTANGGSTSNGIYGIVSLRLGEGPLHGQSVEVLVTCTNKSEFYGEEMPDDKDILKTFEKAFSDRLLYFAPTNLFCGVIELRDSSGAALPLLKPEISMPEAYPPSFPLRNAKRSNPHPSAQYPKPLAFPRELLAHFQLADLFDIKQPGDYTLTVWPKIYKRSSTNSDLCVRFDLPPVSATFKWDGDSQK
jgi:hypothetical protein